MSARNSPEPANRVEGVCRALYFWPGVVDKIFKRFEKSDSEIVDDLNTAYLKNLVDHVVHATEAIESYQVMLNDQMNTYQTKQSNKLNDILRVLTVFSVIFIPLTFIAGVYGTNFEYLPELKLRYGYFYFWSVIVITAVGMLGFFRWKRWL